MDQSIGRPAPEAPAKPLTRAPINGRYTTLTALEQSDAAPLYTHLGGEQNADLWTWIPESGMPDQAACDARVGTWLSADDFHVFTISTGPASDPASEPAGIAAFIGLVPEHLRIEVGCIVGKKLQRTRAATEMFFLMIRHAIEELGYHRVEWKAHNANKASVSAAERLGFVKEGVFRNHMIVNGRVRDTTWLSITSEDWPTVKKGFEAWLSEDNFDAGGKQIRTLKECREGSD